MSFFFFFGVDTGGPVVAVWAGADVTLVGTEVGVNCCDGDLYVILRPSSLMKRDRMNGAASGAAKSSGGSGPVASSMNLRQICAGYVAPKTVTPPTFVMGIYPEGFPIHTAAVY